MSGEQIRDTENMVILWIGRSDSRCGGCNTSCLPREKSHDTPCGYDQHPGCGATYTHVTTISVGDGIELAAQKMRPDLEWIDSWTAYGVESTRKKGQS